jgi:hypothetical protein
MNDDNYYPQFPRNKERKTLEYRLMEERWLLDIYYWESFKIHQGTSLVTGSTITIDPRDYDVVGEYRDKLLYEKKRLEDNVALLRKTA